MPSQFFRYLPATLAVMFILAFVQTSHADEPPDTDSAAYDLRPIWQNDQVSRYRVTSTSNRSAAIQVTGQPEQSFTMSIEAEAELTWRVIEANPDGGGKCELSINDMHYKIVTPQGDEYETDLNSGDDQLKEVRERFSAIADNPITLHIDTDGRVSKIENADAIFESISDSPNISDDKTEDFLKEMGTLLVALVGAQADMTRGQTWNQDFLFPMQIGSYSYDSNYELIDVENIAGINVAVISGSSDVDIIFDTPNLPPNAPGIDTEVIQGHQDSQFMFDLSRREIIGKYVSQITEYEITQSQGSFSISRTVREEETESLIRIAESDD